MAGEDIERVVRNIDKRVTRVEQYLPALATREELHGAIAPLATKEELRAAVALLATKEELRAAIAPLATKEELRAAIAPLATREEMHAAIAAAVAPLPTREEMRAAIKAEGESARHHATLLFEDLRDDNRLIIEHLLALSARVDDLARH